MRMSNAKYHMAHASTKLAYFQPGQDNASDVLDGMRALTIADS